MAAHSEAELQAYLQQHGVEALLKEIVLKLCVSMPDNVLEFVRDYVAAKAQEQQDDEPM